MTGYVSNLRGFVGANPVILTGAALILERSDGAVLFQRRSDNALWSLPGGMLEMGESVEGAARRKAFEEVGVEADALELLGVVSGPRCRYEYPNGDVVWNVTLMFRTRSWTGRPHAKSETRELRWATFGELRDVLSPPTAVAADMLDLA